MPSFSETGVQTDLYQWASRNPPPATIMVITVHEELEHLASTFSGLEEEGYIILPTYPQPNPAPPSLPKLCFWETLLSGVSPLSLSLFEIKTKIVSELL